MGAGSSFVVAPSGTCGELIDEESARRLAGCRTGDDSLFSSAWSQATKNQQTPLVSAQAFNDALAAKMLENEHADRVVEFDGSGGDQSFDEFAAAALNSHTSGETAVALRILAESTGISGRVNIRADCAESVSLLALDLASNSVSGIDFSGDCALVVRSLSLAGNPLHDGPPDLTPLCNLLALDLSFCDASRLFNSPKEGEEEGRSIWAPLARLRKLSLSSAGISNTSSTSGGESIFAGLQELTFLALDDNDLEDHDSLSGLRALPTTLYELDLRENEVCSGPEAVYRDAVVEMVPSLGVLDNKLLRIQSEAVRLDKIEGLREAVTRGGTLADAAEGNDACSCLEGVPCEIEYGCKNWAQRFEVAAAVVKRDVHAQAGKTI